MSLSDTPWDTCLFPLVRRPVKPQRASVSWDADDFINKSNIFAPTLCSLRSRRLAFKWQNKRNENVSTIKQWSRVGGFEGRVTSLCCWIEISGDAERERWGERGREGGREELLLPNYSDWAGSALFTNRTRFSNPGSPNLTSKHRGAPDWETGRERDHQKETTTHKKTLCHYFWPVFTLPPLLKLHHHFHTGLSHHLDYMLLFFWFFSWRRDIHRKKESSSCPTHASSFCPFSSRCFCWGGDLNLWGCVYFFLLLPCASFLEPQSPFGCAERAGRSAAVHYMEVVGCKTEAGSCTLRPGPGAMLFHGISGDHIQGIMEEMERRSKTESRLAKGMQLNGRESVRARPSRVWNNG